MSDSLSEIEYDKDLYYSMCQLLSLQPVEDFYKHGREISFNYGFKSIEELMNYKNYCKVDGRRYINSKCPLCNASQPELKIKPQVYFYHQDGAKEEFKCK